MAGLQAGLRINEQKIKSCDVCDLTFIIRRFDPIKHADSVEH